MNIQHGCDSSNCQLPCRYEFPVKRLPEMAEKERETFYRDVDASIISATCWMYIVKMCVQVSGRSRAGEKQGGTARHSE